MNEASFHAEVVFVQSGETISHCRFEDCAIVFENDTTAIGCDFYRCDLLDAEGSFIFDWSESHGLSLEYRKLLGPQIRRHGKLKYPYA
jgi:hypothetical protein